jgi:tRNA (guanosine-2'-O-)-methyltransferase
MGGGGPRYEPLANTPRAEDLVLEQRKERIDQILALRTRSLVVVLDRLEDTFNMAAVLRTCEGLGLQEVHVIENPEAPFTPNATVTQGCDKWLDLHKYRSFGDCKEALKSRGFSLFASALSSTGQSLYSLKFDQKVALIFGNERFGVSTDVLEGADGIFWIPMRGFTQSFNISVAVAMSLGRAVSWRAEHLGEPGDLTETEQGALRDQFQRLSVKQRKRLFKPASAP